MEMPGIGVRYSATYESPYREDGQATPQQGGHEDEKKKPVVTIRGYDDRDANSASASRPQVRRRCF